MCSGRAAYCYAMINIAEARSSVNDVAGMTHLSMPIRCTFSTAPASLLAILVGSKRRCALRHA